MKAHNISPKTDTAERKKAKRHQGRRGCRAGRKRSTQEGRPKKTLKGPRGTPAGEGTRRRDEGKGEPQGKEKAKELKKEGAVGVQGRMGETRSSQDEVGLEC